MKIFLDLAFAFLVLGVVEAFVKPIAKKWVQRRFLRAAPGVLKKIDAMLPYLVLHYSGEELQEKVRLAFEEVTGESWGEDEINPFFELYDIRKAADNKRAG